MNYNLRYGKSRHTYEFYYIYADSLVQTNYFLGNHLGISVGKIVPYKAKHQFVPSFGAGLDFVKAIDEPDEPVVSFAGEYPITTNSKKDNTKYMYSYNLSINFQYRYVFRNHNFMAIEAGYELLDYTIQSRTS